MRFMEKNSLKTCVRKNLCQRCFDNFKVCVHSVEQSHKSLAHTQNMLQNVRSEWFEPASLLKLTLFHVCFSHFLNCTNGTKSRNASQLFAGTYHCKKNPLSDTCKRLFENLSIVLALANILLQRKSIDSFIYDGKTGIKLV